MCLTATDDYATLPRSADEVRRVVRAAGARVDSQLRVRAEGTRAIHTATRGVRRENAIGRLPLLHPLLERRDHVEVVRTVAAGAMPHPRRHEQPVAILHVLSRTRATERLHDAPVVLRAVARRDLRVA